MLMLEKANKYLLIILFFLLLNIKHIRAAGKRISRRNGRYRWKNSRPFMLAMLAICYVRAKYLREYKGRLLRLRWILDVHCGAAFKDLGGQILQGIRGR